MNNTMKKIAAVLSAGILSAIPMTGSLTSNAAALPDDTVKYYFGDVDLDGKITASDAQTVLTWAHNGVAGVSADKKKRADVDGDGNISVTDAETILTYYSNETLCHLKLYGDADRNGKVNTNDAIMVEEYKRTGAHQGEIDLIAADVNGDGKITTTDHVLIGRYKQNMIPTLYVNWGDFDSNGVINDDDCQKLARFVGGDVTVRATAAEKRRVDLNLDGKIDTVDLTWLLRRVSRGYFDWNK